MFGNRWVQLECFEIDDIHVILFSYTIQDTIIDLNVFLNWLFLSIDM